ncbi:MAG: hypothetical protein U0903_12330 [Planctomycetales bacterium]
MFRIVRKTGLAALCLLGLSASAFACPSCRNANDTDSRLPMAYQTSILFMLSIPLTLGTVLSVGLYRLNKAQEAAVEAFESGDVWTTPRRS